MGYAGTDWEDEVEADSLADAEEMAFEAAVQMIEYGAEEIE